jgi:aminoglycoside phosphotransferase (APT) family kinase protein
MLALTDASGTHSVLRLMTNEPWRTHGAQLTSRERAAQLALASTPVPAPTSIALDAAGSAVGVAAHLMSRLPGSPPVQVDAAVLSSVAAMLATIHDEQPVNPFGSYQSWAWEAKWVVPPWTQHPASWQRAFSILSEEPPAHDPTFLHRDYSHRNLLCTGDDISGVVDWVETSTGPAWLDAAHASTNLALAFDLDPARSFIAAYAELTGREPDRYWLVMGAVGFLPPPGKTPMFGSATELARLDAWLHELVPASG